MIEGIGDDIVYGLGGFALAIIPLFGTLMYWSVCQQAKVDNRLRQGKDRVNDHALQSTISERLTELNIQSPCWSS